MIVAVLSVIGGIFFLAAFARYNGAAVLKDWELLLSSTGRRTIADLESALELDRLLAERAHGKARSARARNEVDEAVRLLGLATAVVDEAVQGRLKRLRVIATFSRMVSAYLPVPPLVPTGFHVLEIATLAGLARLVHEIVVGTRDRLRFRIAVLAACYRLLRRAARRSAAAAGRDPLLHPPWDAFRLGLADLETLDREHVRSLHLLLVALAKSSGAQAVPAGPPQQSPSGRAGPS
jgi:hypothetical protein